MSVTDDAAADAYGFHDPLTTLPNRALLMQRVKQALARSGRIERPIAVLFIDLDNFKQINDTLGHQAGDHLLILIAGVLQASLRASDTAARLAGDEFVVLLEDLNNPAEAALVAERILKQLAAPFSFGGREVQVSASVGVAISNSPLDAPEELLHRADVAMYRAKQQGKNRFEVFDQRLSREIHERLRTEHDLRRALEHDELRLLFQPEVRLSDDAIVGVEALVHWERPGYGLLGPEEFLPLAEETGLSLPIGRWALGEACRQAHGWRQSDPKLVMSVNLSAREFYRAELVQEVASALRESGLEPGGLALEIPEEVAMRDPERASAIFLRLHGLGVKLAIDRFGEACASLRHLRSWPLFFVKIDRALVAELIGNRESAALVGTLIDVAHALDLRVLAEGVEIAAEAVWLRERHCDLAQGDYFARPSGSRMIGLLFGQDIGALA
ncbi:MAG TPA: EAL domain-containing protein [Thermomicrobiaceae bacterium]|nr:EAL domain-containing protein [Thermomicrobiaceae bacterium]